MIDVVGMPTPIHRYRVLFSDGATLDVLAHQDSSAMRGWVYEAHYGRPTSSKAPGAERDRIEGVADLGLAFEYVPDPGDTDAPVSRRETVEPKPPRRKATDDRPAPAPAESAPGRHGTPDK